MKKLSKILASSLVLGTIISSSFMTSSYASSLSSLPTSETQNEIESTYNDGVVGADKFLAPGESYSLSVRGKNTALFTIMAYTQPNTVNIKISDSDRVHVNEAFVDMRGEYTYFIDKMHPMFTYTLTVTNLSTSMLPVGMMITPNVAG